MLMFPPQKEEPLWAVYLESVTMNSGSDLYSSCPLSTEMSLGLS